MKDCKKCFLSPDMCGAKNDKSCERIYENKWRMRLNIIWEFLKVFVPIILTLTFMVIASISILWHFRII